MSTPLNGRRTSAGSVCSMISQARFISDLVCSRTYQTTAAAFRPLPSIEMRLAMKTSRKPRWLSTLRIRKPAASTTADVGTSTLVRRGIFTLASGGCDTPRMRRCTRVAGLWLLLWIVGVTAAETPQPLEVLHDGEPLKLVFAAPVGREKPLTVGPWKLGPSLKRVKNGKPERPSDKRLTLYFIAPGTQYQNPAVPALDHNLLVNTAPANDDPITAEFDLFWVIVLDPDLTKDLRTEQD